MNFIASNAKALIGAAVAFLGALQVGMAQDGLSGSEVVGALVAGLVALGAVFGVQNRGQASAQAVVDQVKALVPPEAAAQIDAVVPAARGVLKSVS